MVETFNLCLQKLKILNYDLIEYLPLFLIRADIILGYLLDIFDGVASVHLLALAVVLDASLRLADRT